MTRKIDARAMRCPWPAIQLARALRDGVEQIEILADDPAAERELADVAHAAGALFECRAAGRFIIRRAARV